MLLLLSAAGGAATGMLMPWLASGRRCARPKAGRPTRSCLQCRCVDSAEQSCRGCWPCCCDELQPSSGATPAFTPAIARRPSWPIAPCVHQAYEGAVFDGVRPLYFSTASQLGLMPTRGIPGLVVSQLWVSALPARRCGRHRAQTRCLDHMLICCCCCSGWHRTAACQTRPPRLCVTCSQACWCRRHHTTWQQPYAGHCGASVRRHKLALLLACSAHLPRMLVLSCCCLPAVRRDVR
jgi:hypothetical protein